MQFKVNINMNDAQAPSGSFEPLPPGEYLIEVLSAEVKPTATPGRNLIVLQFKVEEPAEFRNRRIFDRRNLPLDTEGPESFVAQRLKELFDAFPGTFDYDTGSGDTDMMVGMRAMIRTRNENDNRPDHAGEVQTRVQRIYLPQDESTNTSEVPVEAPVEAPKAAAKPATVPAKPAAPKPVSKPALATKPAAVATAPVQRSPFRRPANIPTPQ